MATLTRLLASRRQTSPRSSARSRRFHFDSLEDRLLLSTYTVLNINDAGAGSLRQAIVDANATLDADLIEFNISGVGVQTIQPLSALPTITSPVTINGYSQPGSVQNTDTLTGGNNAVLQIELDGSLAGTVTGLIITAGNSTVRGLVINRFQRDGIQLEQGDGNVIEGNYIGTDPSGTVELGNGSAGTGQGSSGFPGAGGGGADYFGVLVGSRVFTSDSAYRSSANRIGTNGDGVSDVAERNLISGNDGADIVIVGVGSDSNVVAGNFIGTDRTGTLSLSLSNGTVGEGIGVLVGSGAQFNRIGTDGNGVADVLERNVISGHTGSATTADQHTRSRGVVLVGLGTQNNVVAGNYVGTDVTGTLPLANGDGVKLLGTQGNRVGTNSDGSGDAAERNIISGNGIGVSMDNASGNLVAGNFIGTDVTGTTAVPNGSFVNVTSVGAITLTNSLGNTIGGPSAAARNVISGNGATGIFVQTSIVPTSNSIQGNFIGTDVTGTLALGNAGHGVLIAGGGVMELTRATNGDGQ